MNESDASHTIDDLSYEEAYQKLEEIVKALEQGEQSLESSMELFEHGQALIRRCMSLLDKAELRIKQITENGLVDFQAPE